MPRSKKPTVSKRNLKRIEKKNRQAIRLKQKVSDEKTARAIENPSSIYSMQMTWHCKESDCTGKWSWGTHRQWCGDDWDAHIHPKLKDFEALTWAEIDSFSAGGNNNSHKMHHNMQVEKIRDEAQTRLIEIDKYEDIIFRFRLGGTKRLWGFRRLNVFEVLWYDPTHQVYPTEPR